MNLFLKKRRQKQQAFTLIEILITSIVLVLISSIGFVTFFTSQKNTQLYSNAEKIAIYMEIAKEKSINQENGHKWGLHIEHPTSGQSFWQIFYGNIFSSSTALSPIYLPKGIEFYLPAGGESENFFFKKITGYLETNSATSTIIYSLAEQSQKKKITVSKYGVIDYIDYQ